MTASLHPAQSYAGCRVVILPSIKKKKKKNHPGIYIDDTTESEQMSHCLAFSVLTTPPRHHRLSSGQTTVMGHTPENNRPHRQPRCRVRRSRREEHGRSRRLKRCFGVPVSTNPGMVQSTITLEGAIDSSQERMWRGGGKTSEACRSGRSPGKAVRHWIGLCSGTNPGMFKMGAFRLSEG